MWHKNSNCIFFLNMCVVKKWWPCRWSYDGHFLPQITRTLLHKTRCIKIDGTIYTWHILLRKNWIKTGSGKSDTDYVFYLAMCQVNLTDMTIVYVPPLVLFTTFNKAIFLHWLQVGSIVKALFSFYCALSQPNSSLHTKVNYNFV